MVPRGADAVVMVEARRGPRQRTSDRAGRSPPAAGSRLREPTSPPGETVLRRGQLLTSRDTGVLAAIGVANVSVWRKPVVAILSTGDEIIAPGEPMRPAKVYDSNGQVLADAVRELGGEPLRLGITHDDIGLLCGSGCDTRSKSADIVLLSGGTSKGAGDVSYRVVAELDDPGIVAHGVALKPGKPICLAATGGRAVVVLPGFPTSAIFTFHEFVAPVIRLLAGRGCGAEHSRAGPARRQGQQRDRPDGIPPGRAGRDNADRDSLAAYPMGQGSGSVTTFSRADGFATIGRHEEIVQAGTIIDVQLLGRDLQLADLVVIGSHCIALDYLLGELQRTGRALEVSRRRQHRRAGCGQARRMRYRRRSPARSEDQRIQSAVPHSRPRTHPRLRPLAGHRLPAWRFAFRRPVGRRRPSRAAIADPACVMVNRNKGSGTRVLIDRLLGGARPPGYAVQPRNHNAVAAAVVQGRADWGMTLDTIARNAGLGFLPVQAEQYDFIVPRSRADRPGVIALSRELR